MLPASEVIELVVIDDGRTVATATVPVATVAGLVVLKTVAIPRRASSNNPQKVGSDIHDVVRLIEGEDVDALAADMAAFGDEVAAYVGETLVRWFSPDQDLRYTFARLRRLSRSADVDQLTEDDLAVLASLGRLLREPQRASINDAPSTPSDA